MLYFLYCCARSPLKAFVEPPSTCTRPTSMGDASNAKEPTHEKKASSYMSNFSQDLLWQKKATPLKPIVSKKLAKDSMEGDIVEGANVEGVAFVAKSFGFKAKI